MASVFLSKIHFLNVNLGKIEDVGGAAFWIDILKFHTESLAAQEKELLILISEYKEKIKEIFKHIDRDRFPTLNHPIIHERIDNLKIIILDPLMGILKEMQGAFIGKTHVIKIIADVSTNETWHTFVHEIFHSISGQTEIAINPLELSDLTCMEETKLKRIGLRFSGSTGLDFTEEIETNPPNFRWLNEAITEDLTQEIVQNDKGIYKKERELLALLTKDGLKRTTVEMTYFENYRHFDGKHSTPSLRELFREANQKFYPGFLVDLDRFINSFLTEEEGVKHTVDLWETLGDKFPAEIKEITANQRSIK